MKKRKRHLHKDTLKHTVLVVLALCLVVGGVGLLWLSSLKLPDLNDLESREISQSTKIYDRTGKVLLYDVHEDVQRTIVPFDKISPYVKNATVAIEDATFYQHGGVRFSSIVRAVLSDIAIVLHLSSGNTQGGSTITQQVIKNTVLTQEKSITRKLKEWVLAIKLDESMDKDSILGIYLNESPYGGNMYGIEEAAQTYFGTSAADVDLAQAAYLAALPNAPTYYSPYGNHRSDLDNRKNLVLEKMLENKFITQDEYDAAKAEQVTFEPQKETGITAPHFVLFVKEQLEQEYGPRALTDEGLTVITSLDANLQAKAEEIVNKDALSNEKNFNASNAGLIAIDPKTGEILAMVGSRNYFDKKIDGNFNVTLAKRQPGSSFKPFVYATALEKGYTPDTVVFDVPIEFSTYCNPDGTPINPGDADKCYEPVDFDNQYRGPVKMRNALAQSLNIPAIQFLYLAGLNDSLQTAKNLGITTLGDANQYGLTLVLGGGEVTLLEMTDAYGVFADEGLRNPYVSVLSVTDQNGLVLESYTPSPTQVLDKDIALTITDMLSDNVARAPEFGLDSALYFPGREVAAKTGTTNDYRDAWIIGYTPSLVVGAWAGNNDNSPMVKKIAGFIVAPMWHEFMDAALASTSPERFDRPAEKDVSNLKPVLRGYWQGNQTYTIDSASGKLATAATPPETSVEKVVTDVHSILYWVDKNDPLGPPPTNPTNDPQFQNWEYSVQKWVADNHIQNETTAVIPTATDDVHTPANAPHLTLSGITPNVVYPANSPISLSISAQSRYPMQKVDYFFNDAFIGSSKYPPFTITFTPTDLPNVSGINTVKAVGYDAVYNESAVVTGLDLLLTATSTNGLQ